MLLKIKGPKSYFWQWDLDRQLVVGEDTCGEVHFCNGTTECALVCEIYQQDGQRLVNVPNIFLQTDRDLTAYLYRKGSDGSLTRHQQTFRVVRRNKPDDYVYTETEVKTWTALEDRVKALEENSGAVKTVNGVVPDVSGNIEIDALPDDTAQLALLIEADLLPAVYDSNGAILTDENGNIILRY